MFGRKNENRTGDQLSLPRMMRPPDTPTTRRGAPAAGPSDKRLAPVPGRNEHLALMLGLVRDIRAEAQNLKRSLSEIKTEELKASLNESIKVFEFNKTQIEARLQSLRKLLEEQPRLYDLHGDGIVIIENLWERVKLSWPKPEEEDEKEVLGKIAKADQDLNELVFHAGYLTIPPRVNQHLDQLRIGQSLDFHKTFEDELPKFEDRLKILGLMYSHPLQVEGAVDVENGLIYRASPDRWRRASSYMLMLGTFVAGALIVYLFAHLGAWLTLANWPATPERFTELMVGYLFITIGGIGHIGIDVLKQARSSKGERFVALEDLALWVHVKELSIVVGILSFLIGILGMAILTPKVEWQTAFFVGYSIDSFIDLFLQRFGKTVAATTEALKEQLG